MNAPLTSDDLIGLSVPVWLARLTAARKRHPESDLLWHQEVIALYTLGYGDKAKRCLTAWRQARPSSAMPGRTAAEIDRAQCKPAAQWGPVFSRRRPNSSIRMETAVPLSAANPDAPLLVLEEDGIGDQIRWAHHLTSIASGSAIVVNGKISGLLARHYPQHHFIQAEDIRRYKPSHKPVYMADLDRLYWQHPAPLRPETHISAHPEHKARWQAALNAACTPGNRRIGFCFRSMHVTLMRSVYYLQPEDLAPFFERSDCDFVSLQYGQTAEETARLRALLGDRLIMPDGFDPIDDMEGLAGMTACLDAVLSASTLAADMASAMGVPVWRFMLGAGDAARLSDHRHWYGAASTPLFRSAGDRWYDIAARAASDTWP